MQRVILVLLLALGACTPEPSHSPYRNLSTPITSIAVIDQARITGEWQEVASFRERGPCVLCRVQFRPMGTSIMLKSDAGNGRLKPSGPGRFVPQGLSGKMAEPWWVLWVDADYRTLVIGTPSGKFGAILNRGHTDAGRQKAAREILDWTGYDTKRLRTADF